MNMALTTEYNLFVRLPSTARAQGSIQPVDLAGSECVSVEDLKTKVEETFGISSRRFYLRNGGNYLETSSTVDLKALSYPAGRHSLVESLRRL